jgi:membrane protein involved in colicin uptake
LIAMRLPIAIIAAAFAAQFAGPADALTPRRSPEQQAADARDRARATSIIREGVQRCYSVPSDAAGRAVKVRMQLNPDGSLAGKPAVLGRLTDNGQRLLAQAAVRAIVRCAPYVMPDDLRGSPYLWTGQTLHFKSDR